jgi:hypothetical protein
MILGALNVQLCLKLPEKRSTAYSGDHEHQFWTIVNT